MTGGGQHDYLLHSLTDQAEFAGVDLGAPAEGSLAGADVGWGALQLNDGDMEGFPGRPYWSPPPGNGLGFLMEPERGRTDGPWSATWPLPEGDAFLKLTMLGQPGTEVISAWAPGIYPHLPKTRYAIARRVGESLGSTYIGVLEPYGRRLPGTRIDASTLAASAEASAGAMKLLPSLNVLLHQAAATGDELTWQFEVPEAGEQTIIIEHYLSPSYGKVQLLIDGEPLGDELTGTGPDVNLARPATVGTMALMAGTHRAALRATADDGQGHYWFGVRAMWLTPAGGGEADTEPRPLIESVKRLEGESGGAGLVVTLESGARDVVLAATDAETPRAFSGAGLEASLFGRFAHIRLRDVGPTEVHLVGAKRLTLGELEVECAEAETEGTITSLNVAEATLETNVTLPTDGRLDGQIILFDSPRYSRNTAHRIARIEATDAGSRIVLESPSLILGTGILEDEPDTDTQFVSLLAHEYARSDSLPGTQFFSGKRITGQGFATNLVRTEFGQLMKCHVDSTEGMTAGAEFVIQDVQAGDTFRIPTTAHALITDAAVTGPATTAVTVRKAGAEVGRLQP